MRSRVLFIIHETWPLQDEISARSNNNYFRDIICLKIDFIFLFKEIQTIPK